MKHNKDWSRFRVLDQWQYVFEDLGNADIKNRLYDCIKFYKSIISSTFVINN